MYYSLFQWKWSKKSSQLAPLHPLGNVHLHYIVPFTNYVNKMLGLFVCMFYSSFNHRLIELNWVELNWIELNFKYFVVFSCCKLTSMSSLAFLFSNTQIALMKSQRFCICSTESFGENLLIFYKTWYSCFTKASLLLIWQINYVGKMGNWLKSQHVKRNKWCNPISIEMKKSDYFNVDQE